MRRAIAAAAGVHDPSWGIRSVVRPPFQAAAKCVTIVCIPLSVEEALGHRINVMLDDSVWAELQKVPPGERSRLISEAVGKELRKRGRAQAAAAMDRLRASPRKVSRSAEELVRADRDSHW